MGHVDLLISNPRWAVLGVLLWSASIFAADLPRGWSLRERFDAVTGQRTVELGHDRGADFELVEPLATLGESASDGTQEQLIVVRAEPRPKGLWLVTKRIRSGKNGDCAGLVVTEEEETVLCTQRCVPAEPSRLTITASCIEAATAAPCLRAPIELGASWLEESSTRDLDGTRSRSARKSIISLEDGGVGSVEVAPLSARAMVEGHELSLYRSRPIDSLGLPAVQTTTSEEDGGSPPERLASALIPWGEVKVTPLRPRVTKLGPAHAWTVVVTGERGDGAHGWIERRTISGRGELVVLDGTRIVVSARIRGEEVSVITSRLCEENQNCPSHTRRAPLQVDVTARCR